MTTPTPSDNTPEPMTFAELRALLEQAARTSADNTRSNAAMRARHDQEMTEIRARQEESAARHDRETAEIRARQEERTVRWDRETAEIRARQEESATRHDQEMAEIRARQEERAARHDREMAEIRAAQSRTEKVVAENAAAITRLERAQERTSQDVSVLKGWGLEFLCERRPELFADAFSLRRIELFPKAEIFRIASDALCAGVITRNERTNAANADAYFYGIRERDRARVLLVVQASFAVKSADVERAARQAGILNTIIHNRNPDELRGTAFPVVAGTEMATDGVAKLRELGDVSYVHIENGNQLIA